MRLFVSVDLDDLGDAIAAAQTRVADASGLDLTDPEQAHVTLKFLGEQPEEAVPELAGAIERAVEAAEITPFEARIAGLGAFPSEDYIRVVWLGVDAGSAELTALHERIEAALVARGQDPAEHAFTPHVTVGRMHHAGGKELVQAALAEAGPAVGTTRVEEVRLTESAPGTDGPEYQTVERFPLG